MKKFANVHRHDVVFDIGDWVYLKLQPYRRQSVTKRHYDKLSPRYFGPYMMLGRVGEVAYLLDVPETAKIHPVFHVSQLKRAVGDKHHIQPDITTLNDQMELILEPEHVTQLRWNDAERDWEYLVQWKDQPSHEVIWESYATLVNQYPDFHLEDKVALLHGVLLGLQSPKFTKGRFAKFHRLSSRPGVDKEQISSVFEHIFHYPLPSVSQEEEEADDLFLYTLTSPTPSPALPPASTPNRPPIPKIYSYRQQPPGECSIPKYSLLSDPGPSDEFPIALGKGKHSCTYPIASYVSYDHLSSPTCSFVKSLDFVSIPKTVHEALSHSGWLNATIKEVNALNDNGTWDLMILPTEKKTIGCKWVFAIKVNPDGSIARLKASLMAKGYAQTHGIDYFDTLSPISKLTSVRKIGSQACSIAMIPGLQLFKMENHLRILKDIEDWLGS
ncbi:ty3-gypsy retrotransposon protein [Cucumis melo var. makuwa]|uniref:Ty3-gypsy retrotransposon protein n=1 Tax=Cucumis melo var. makuwa TaxID=1194695 RepID=A0A5A7TVM7_CUCMM|nr:ty3-gypsy retrotransposon protein [Cucumis melo var. makuwa]TYK08260.1 ty3-gypsy retrotransposon protein [Cucumis melo var. makuwa]